MEIIYLLVALFSTIFGALAGVGGGVIIKPVLDTIGGYDVATIGLLSSITVLSMAIVSTTRQILSKVKVEGLRTFFLVLGSILGGILGNMILNYTLIYIEENTIKIIQSGTLCLLLIFVLVFVNEKSKLKTYNIHNKLVIVITGIILGFIASFLGIGGGPINVAFLYLIFSMDAKIAAIHSILIIMLSQFAKVASISFTTGFSNYNLEMLLYMIPGGILGGLIGTNLIKKLSKSNIKWIFNFIILLIIVLNILNLIKFSI
ncbi:sulfite exporter TauE/SafE family protein [Mycoplasmatota bacterium zrk1]